MVNKTKSKRINRGQGRGYPIRCSMDFLRLVNEIRARHLLNGKRMPTYTKVTQMICNKMRKEGTIFEDEFIKLN